MSSDSENDRVSYLARYPIDQEEVSRTGRRIIWANEFSYTYKSTSTIIEGLQYFRCNRQRVIAIGQKKDCKGKGFVRILDNHFYVTKDHFHISKELEFEV
uniref:Uncharacterized protein n=1 Tax=Ditylenchus dipsaci TaxID=166011 RepID=A0A915EB08_9BILA